MAGIYVPSQHDSLIPDSIRPVFTFLKEMAELFEKLFPGLFFQPAPTGCSVKKSREGKGEEVMGGVGESFFTLWSPPSFVHGEVMDGGGIG